MQLRATKSRRLKGRGKRGGFEAEAGEMGGGSGRTVRPANSVIKTDTKEKSSLRSERPVTYV